MTIFDMIRAAVSRSGNNAPEISAGQQRVTACAASLVEIEQAEKQAHAELTERTKELVAAREALAAAEKSYIDDPTDVAGKAVGKARAALELAQVRHRPAEEKHTSIVSVHATAKSAHAAAKASLERETEIAKLRALASPRRAHEETAKAWDVIMRAMHELAIAADTIENVMKTSHAASARLRELGVEEPALDGKHFLQPLLVHMARRGKSAVFDHVVSIHHALVPPHDIALRDNIYSGGLLTRLDTVLKAKEKPIDESWMRRLEMLEEGVRTELEMREIEWADHREREAEMLERARAAAASSAPPAIAKAEPEPELQPFEPL